MNLVNFVDKFCARTDERYQRADEQIAGIEHIYAAERQPDEER